MEKSICLIQITRLGDLIQTYQAASLLKKKSPDIELVLVARKQFALPLSFILEKIFNKIYYLDGQEMVLQDGTLLDCKNRFFDFLKELGQHSFDVVINLSWSRSSAYLCSLIKSKHRLGMFRNKSNEICVEDKWSQLVYSITMRGPQCPFSIVDIYKSIMGVEGERFRPIIRKGMKKKQIVMHLFASSEKKYWKGDKWVEIIYQILRNYQEYEVVLVGAKSEIEKSKDIINTPLLNNYKKRIVSKVGKVSLQEVYNTLLESSLFVGHDSSISHLASLTDIPIISLGLGTVRTHETSPYSENAYVIIPKTSCFPCFPADQCHFYQCHIDIPYQVVFQVIAGVLGGDQLNIRYLKRVTNSFLTNKLSIFKVEISKENFVHLKNIISTQSSFEDVFRVFYRMAFLYIFCGIEEDNNYPDLDHRISQDIEEALLGVQQLYELSEFGKKYAMHILEEMSKEAPNLDEIKRYSDQIGEVDKLREIVSKTYPVLRPVEEYFRVGHFNLLGDNIVEITENSFHCYHEASLFCSVIYELAKKVLERSSLGPAREKMV